MPGGVGNKYDLLTEEEYGWSNPDETEWSPEPKLEAGGMERFLARVAQVAQGAAGSLPAGLDDVAIAGGAGLQQVLDQATDSRVRRNQVGGIVDPMGRAGMNLDDLFGPGAGGGMPPGGLPPPPKDLADTTTTTSMPIPNAAAERQVGQARQGAQAAMGQAMRTGADTAIEIKKLVSKRTAMAEAIRTSGKDDEVALRASFEKARSRIEARQAKMDKLVDAVDAGRIWREAGPGRSALAIILQGIAGAGAAGAGQSIPNTIQDIIDRDVQLQLTKLGKKREHAALLNQLDMDEHDLEIAVRQGHREALMKTFDALGSQIGDAQAISRLAAAKSQIARAYHQDTMANANRLMGQKTVARTKSPFKEWQAASAAFMKDPGKPITPDFLLKQNRGAEVVETSLNLVGELRDLIAEGGGLGRIESMSAAGWLANSKSATMYSRLKSFVRRIKRAAGVDVGNLALKEGTIMVESVLGNNWSRAQTAKEEMTKEAMTQLKTWAGVYKGLSINNDVRELDPAKKRIATAVDRYWRGEAIAKAKKKKRK